MQYLQKKQMIEHSDLSYPVYRQLREMILKNELKPGEKLLQEKLAASLGVSRTPLLKALRMLEHEFLVESIPRRGMFVKKLSVEEMKEIYDVREAFECMAIKLAAEKITPSQLGKLRKLWKPFEGKTKMDAKAYLSADEAFHEMLFDIAGNNTLRKAYNLTFVQSRIVQLGLMRPPEETLPEHLGMIAALEKRDAGLAVKVMGRHIANSREHISNKFGSQ
jgi:DNA-binding GntR family transcriptional regulator